MGKNSKWLLRLSIIFISIIVLPNMVQAQTEPSDPTGDPDAPIDGGIGLLVVAGVGYGIKKARDSRKKKTTHFL